MSSNFLFDRKMIRENPDAILKFIEELSSELENFRTEFTELNTKLSEQDAKISEQDTKLSLKSVMSIFLRPVASNKSYK